MKTILKIVSIVCWVISSSQIYAHTGYTGYSGAPGTSGYCANSCHGSSGGTIEISGFLSEYVPEQTYTITISHSAGNSIRQFNGSCRFGTGSQNAGVIAAATNTVAYNTAGETNGIHFSSSNQSSGTFLWPEPTSGSGEVRLYIAGLQGNSSGQNSSLTLVATENVSGIYDENGGLPADYSLVGSYPNPFNTATVIEYALPEPSNLTVEIFDILGQKVKTLDEGKKPAGYYQISWDAGHVASGVYFCRFKAGVFSQTKRITLLK